ncbi:SMC-Scp complex subunit ScpB [Kribbella sp. NBC_01484]|uniref:SMC-Scp complex subunit ScpB n=1 Tax=Kribbella sp. NBC_01484 TaxID=2903579 RepID=UPI002E36C181|nr:SMC-Scp complex subunit ScpB [Kribbella sp. NBC_01484]
MELEPTNHAVLNAEEADDTTSSAESGEVIAPESGSNPPQAGATSPDNPAASAEDDVPGHDVVGDEDYLPPGQTEVPVGDEVVIDDDTMRRALEAILMVTDEPLPVLTLARAVGRPTGDVSAALATLAAEYTEQGRGFDLREVGGGWRYYTRVEAAPYVERFVLDGQQARLTQAALETLAVVAYKQPVSRARVSAIRGVNVDGVVRTLVARGLVEEAGADTESQAILYRTTSYFLERMGMQSLDDLPELAPYLPDMDDIEDELAAQTLPPTPEPAPSPDADDESRTPPPAEADVQESPAVSIDADLNTTEADDLEPAADQRQSSADTDEPAEEGEPTGWSGTASADRAGAEESGAASADEPAADDPATGVDGDHTTAEPADREVDPDDAEPTPADDVETGINRDRSTTEPIDREVEHESGDADPGDESESVDADAMESSAETDEPTDGAEPADQAELTPADDTEPADEVELTPTDAAESVGEAELTLTDDTEPADEVELTPTNEAESADEAELTLTDDAESVDEAESAPVGDAGERIAGREAAELGVRDGG